MTEQSYMKEIGKSPTGTIQRNHLTFFFLKMLRKPALKFRSLLSGLAFLLLNTSEVFHCLTYVVHLEHENAYISKKSLRRRHCFGNLGVYSRIILKSI
jgi:hypothetical protein